jgi:CheY-like chemotaxis protein
MAHILVAEDEDGVREFVLRALEADGHSVAGVADGGMAYQRLQEEPFDLLLTDIVMPVMDGVALALAAAALYPAMPILLMTGYAREKERAHNFDSLLADIISKPFSLAQLQTTIRRALGQE